MNRSSAMPSTRQPRARWGARCAIVVLALGAAPHVGAADELTFDQALLMAQQRSRFLPSQEAAASAAREMAVAAGRLPDPTLKAGINNLPINGPDAFSLTNDFMTMRSIGVMQEFTRGDKRKARTARFEREAEMAEVTRTAALANLQRDAASAWLDRYYQERMRDLQVAQRDEARLQIEAAEAAFRGGKGAQADIFAARSAVAQLEDRIAQADRQIATATTQLARWVGDAASNPLARPPAIDTVHLDTSRLDDQLGHHPQIAMMVKQEEIARAEADIASANRHPDWSVELMYSQRGPAYSNMISLNVSIPLPWDRKNRQDRELASKLATAEQLREQREDAVRGHVAEVHAMLQEWQSDRERLVRYDASLLPLAAERTRAALAAYRGGTGMLSAVLEARRNEIDVRMERIRLEMDTARLWAQLEFLIPAGHVAPRPAQ